MTDEGKKGEGDGKQRVTGGREEDIALAKELWPGERGWLQSLCGEGGPSERTHLTEAATGSGPLFLDLRDRSACGAGIGLVGWPLEISSGRSSMTAFICHDWPRMSCREPGRL
jgi:hypothetical protein